MVKNKKCIGTIKYQWLSHPGTTQVFLLPALCRLASDPVDQMHQRHDRVPEEHSWTRITHYFPDPFPHIHFIAMDRAFGTGGFTLLEWA